MTDALQHMKEREDAGDRDDSTHNHINSPKKQNTGLWEKEILHFPPLALHLENKALLI